jgi:hypothetical protein
LKYCCFLLLFLILGGFSAAAQKHSAVYPVAFYNLENLFDPADDPDKNDDEFTPNGSKRYTQAIYQQKLHNLATVIEKLGTDANKDGAALIGVAEIENDKVLSDLCSQPEIKQRGYKYVWYESPDLRGIDVALLYNPKHFTVISSRSIPAPFNGADKTRDVLYVSGRLNGEAVHVLVNHWPSRREGKNETAADRATVAKVNKRIVDSLLKKDAKARIIIMGDLNDNPTDNSVMQTLNAKADKTNAAYPYLYNPWVSVYRMGKGTAAYNDRWDHFDQIIISSGFFTGKLQYRRNEIFDKPFLKQQSGKYKGYPHRSFSGHRWINGYSDHLPVLLYLAQ